MNVIVLKHPPQGKISSLSLEIPGNKKVKTSKTPVAELKATVSCPQKESMSTASEKTRWVRRLMATGDQNQKACSWKG